MTESTARKDAAPRERPQPRWFTVTEAARLIGEKRYQTVKRVMHKELRTYVGVAGKLLVSCEDAERIAEEVRAAAEEDGETAQNGDSAKSRPAGAR